MSTNKPDLAEPLLRELVQMLEKSTSPNHHQLADYQYRYAIALARQGKYDVAQPLMERTLKQQRTHLGDQHRDTVRTMKAYALLLNTTRQTEAAEAIYQQIKQVSYESETNEFER